MNTATQAVSGSGARIGAIAVVLLAGVMTGAQLGKIAPLIPWYREEIGFSLVGSGWLAAILGIFIAVGALPAGWAIDRLGLARSILLGSIALFAGGVALALATSPVFIFGARLVEAVGYLALCVALPAVLNEISPPNWKAPVLAIWSGFVPLGFATSDFLALAMLPDFLESAYLITVVLIFAGFAAAALVLLRGFSLTSSAGASGGIALTLSRDVILLACGFGAFVVLSLSMFTFMPAYVAGSGSHYLVSAGMVALSVPLGNIAAGILVRGKGARFMAKLGIFGFAVSAVTAVPAFTFASPVLATTSALALAISGALVASAQFAAIPFITPRGGSVSVAIGLVCQAGGIGTVIGPPIAAAVIEHAGWTGFAWFLSATAVAGIACMVPLLRTDG
ncbi:MFS transporter [Mesorhizobium sp. CAU 1732]|uniref:MFS transporter n=1 Tax=Mesorhizobium sp. CAU 1732 TaxID=3140358 RepID=UPI0032606032